MSNPYEAGADIPTASPAERTEKTLSIARYQKRLLVCILLLLGVYAMNLIVQLNPDIIPQWFLIPLLIFQLAVNLTAIVSTILLARLVYGPISGIFIGLLVIIPCINLLILLVVSDRATRHLRAAGIRVGLLGAKSADL